MRLIDADALIEFCAERWIPLNIDAVNMQPTIQPEKAQLSQEGTTKDATKDATSDLISRKAAIDAVNNAFDRETLLTGFVRSIAVRAIRELPPAQPEPHKGHWIKHESPDGGEQYECSRCGVLWEFNDGTPEDNEAYFCPKCGADLRGK